MGLASTVHSQNHNDVYILETGTKAEQILEMQHEIFALDSYEQLEKAGLCLGQTVWDIGCGSGTMTEYLAKTVGPTGHVYAFDISEDQINIAKERLQKLGLINVTFHQSDIYTIIDLLLDQPDIIYTRFVFMHLTDPQSAIDQVCKALKPGGVFVDQESTMSTSHASFKNSHLDDYIKTIVALGKHKGVDFEIGDKLVTLCKNSYFSSVDSYDIQHKIDPNIASYMLYARIDEWSAKAIDAQLTTQDIIENWKISLRQFGQLTPPEYYALAKQTYIIARKD